MQTNSRQNNPGNPIPATQFPATQSMNHTSPPYFTNDVKFTGSAFESPGDASTVLFQVVLLLMIIFGIRMEERLN